jgi:hypothetical protein
LPQDDDTDAVNSNKGEGSTNGGGGKGSPNG